MLNSLNNSLCRLYVRVNHVVNTVKRPVLAAKSLRMVLCRRRSIYIVGIVPNAGNLNRTGVNCINKGTRYHVNLVVTANCNKGIRLCNTAFLQRLKIVSVRLKNRTVQSVCRMAHSLRVVVYKSNIILFVNKALGKLNTSKTRANNQNIHGNII